MSVRTKPQSTSCPRMGGVNDDMMLTLDPLQPGDRARWGELARGYKTFYEAELPESGYDEAWRRLMAGECVHGIGARLDGRLVGIAHYLFHGNAWTADVCYLQDLFVDAAARRRGVGRALLTSVAGAARAAGACRLYWLTHEDNAAARALYDQVACFQGYIRYDQALA